MMKAPTTISELLCFAAEKYKKADCIKYIENGSVLVKTYQDMYEDSMAAARRLLDFVDQRAHIAVIGKTEYAYLTALNGVFISGCVAVPIAPETAPDDISYLLREADVDAILYDSSVKEKIDSLPDVRSYILIDVRSDPQTVCADPIPETDPDECAMIMFTSGTTGDKKGVMLSSRAIVSNVLFKEMSYEGGHVALNVLPMHHIFSFSCDYLKNLKDGVCICLNGDIGNIGENLLRFEPTVIRLVPMMIETLLKRTRMIKRRFPNLTDREAAEKVFGGRLRSIIASGAYLSSDIAAEFESMGISIRQGYGMTETGPRIAVPNGKTSIYSVGAVIDICDVRIQDGEIQVKSPSLMMGYYKDPEATKAAFTEDGWFMTGDIGYMAEDRQLYVTGRKKNLIILSNGENISPEEIEKKLRCFPGVEEVLVFADKNSLAAEFYLTPDHVKANGSPQAEAMIRTSVDDYNRSALSEKEIAKVLFRDEPFEKTSTGKIKRANITFKGE